MGGWHGTCLKCTHRTEKHVNETRTANYCKKHEKFMLGRFPGSFEFTKICFEKEE